MLIKSIRIFLLVLIIIGVGLLLTQNIWVPKLVAAIIAHDAPAVLITPQHEPPAPRTSKIPPVIAPVKKVPPAPATLRTVTGSVTLSPTCPVERMPPDPACAPKPYVTQVQVLRTGTTQMVRTTQTQSDGSFTFALESGTYDFRATGGAVYPRCSSQTVAVTDQAIPTINISCDTGIR